AARAPRPRGAADGAETPPQGVARAGRVGRGLQPPLAELPAHGRALRRRCRPRPLQPLLPAGEGVRRPLADAGAPRLPPAVSADAGRAGRPAAAAAGAAPGRAVAGLFLPSPPKRGRGEEEGAGVTPAPRRLPYNGEGSRHEGGGRRMSRS